MRNTHTKTRPDDPGHEQALRQYTVANEAATALSLATSIEELLAQAQQLFRNLYADHHVWLCLLGEDQLCMQRCLP